MAHPVTRPSSMSTSATMARGPPPPKHRGARVDVVLDMAAGTDPDSVPRDVRVPRHDYVAGWEPPPKSSVPAGSWTAVVDHGHRTPCNVDEQVL